jgi:menaquinone-9 beta-reductase
VTTPAVDLVVVGAGPAGTAAALAALAHRPAARVVLMDRARFPRDKTCGDGIGPTGVHALADLGVGNVLDGAVCIDRLRITSPSGVTAAGRVAAPGYVLPRRLLDARLVGAAVDRGAELVQERLTSLVATAAGIVVNGHLTAGAVIGADGVHSAVRRLTGAGTQPRRYRAVSLRAYAAAPTDDAVLVFRLLRQGWPGYAWAFPTGDGQANVGVVLLDGRVPSSRSGLADLLQQTLPEWRPLPSTIRGFHLPLSPGRPAPARGRVLLAGDAAGLVNPVSGEGIATALISGTLAGRSAVGESVTPGWTYQAALHRSLRVHLRRSAWAARAMGARVCADVAVAAAAASPRTFAALAELTVGTGRAAHRGRSLGDLGGRPSVRASRERVRRR